MQSILIVGKDTEKLKEEAKKICDENNISKFDVDIFSPEKAAGIGDIRSLQERIFLKPMKSEKKAAILEAFFGMTIDAQNAFLKVLEEPPVDTIIMLLVTSLDFVLPTVLSRCSLINLEKTKKLTEKEIEDNLRIINSLRFPTNALILAQDFGKNREDALSFLEGLIISLHGNLREVEGAAKALRKLQNTYTTIKGTNVNVRFALENLFLSLFSE